MKFVLIVFQGPTPTVPGSDRWNELPEAQQKAVYADLLERLLLSVPQPRDGLGAWRR
jgi:hypothetical protein